MDRYKESLQHDVRLVRRNLRNHLSFEANVKAYQETLPDSGTRARWMRQDGQLCNSLEEHELHRYHKEGWDVILKG